MFKKLVLFLMLGTEISRAASAVALDLPVAGNAIVTVAAPAPKAPAEAEANPFSIARPEYVAPAPEAPAEEEPNPFPALAAAENAAAAINPFSIARPAYAAQLTYPHEREFLIAIAQIMEAITLPGAENIIPNILVQGFPTQRATIVAGALSPVQGILPEQVKLVKTLGILDIHSISRAGSYSVLHTKMEGWAQEVINGVLLALYDNAVHTCKDPLRNFLSSLHTDPALSGPNPFLPEPVPQPFGGTEPAPRRVNLGPPTEIASALAEP